MFITAESRSVSNFTRGDAMLLWDRHYDPTVGRFATLDPFPGVPTDPQSLHKYVYGHNDPVDNFDPTGAFTISDVGASLRSALGSFARYAGQVFKAYQTATKIIDFIEIVHLILDIATGGLDAVINQVKNLLTPNVFGKHAKVFTREGIERASTVLLDNIGRVAYELIDDAGGQDKLKRIGQAFAGRNPVFVILLPTPPGVNVLSAIPHGRFHPQDEQAFIHMCERCLSDQRPPALVTAATIGDEDAVGILEQFHTLMQRLELRANRNRPVARILRRAKIKVRWVYLLGFFTELPPTVFLSADPGIVDDFARLALQHQTDYAVQERW